MTLLKRRLPDIEEHAWDTVCGPSSETVRQMMFREIAWWYRRYGDRTLPKGYLRRRILTARIVALRLNKNAELFLDGYLRQCAAHDMRDVSLMNNELIKILQAIPN